jgi:hypothetical protein
MSDRIWPRLRILFLTLGFLLLFVNFLVSWSDKTQYAGVDLRPKIVGARALIAGRDPYSYTWSPSDGERYLDPTHRIPGPNGNTYAPSMLLFIYAPTCWMDFKTLRTFWFFAEWAAMLLSIYLLSRLLKNPKLRTIFILIALFFFTNSTFWRLHVERGQYYVFLLLIGSLGWTVYERGGAWRMGGMALLGALAAFRPTYALIGLPLFLLGFRREILVFSISFATVLLMTLPVGGLRVWHRYLENVNLIQASQMDTTLTERLFGPAQSLPTLVEGVDFRRMMFARSTSTTFIQLLKPRLSGDPANAMHYPFLHITMDEAKANMYLLRIDHGLAAAFVILFAALAWLNRGGVTSFRIALLTGVVLAMDIDYFLPQRYSHNDVLFLWLLALALPLLFYRRKALLPLFLVAAGLFFGHSLFPTTEWSFITSLRNLLLMAGFNILVLETLWINSGRMRVRL